MCVECFLFTKLNFEIQLKQTKAMKCNFNYVFSKLVIEKNPFEGLLFKTVFSFYVKFYI